MAAAVLRLRGPASSVAPRVIGVSSAFLVGLTGGIGSGKSAVAALLAERGARVIDADKVAREVVARESSGLAKVIADFGPQMIDEHGDLDRARLAETVFADPRARMRLNAIVHPLVAERIDAMIAEGPPGGVVVYDVPLLVEGSVQERHDFDLILVVEAPEELRIQRLIRDRQMTEDQVRARMATQATDAQHRAVADIVIMNDGSHATLARDVARIWREQISPACGSG